MEPGKPKKAKQFNKQAAYSLGQKKYTPLISRSSRVLNRRLIASTNKKALVDSSAWLINMQKPATTRHACPLITHITSQCISTTVEYATSFFKST